MAITRPVTKTIISTVNFGIPVVDQVNANTDAIANMAPVVGRAQAQVSGTLAGGAWTNVPGIAVTFTPKANWLYEFHYGCCVTGLAGYPGAWWAIGLLLPGNGFAMSTRAQGFSTTNPTWGHTMDATYFANGTLAASPVTVQLQANIAGGGAFNNGQEAYLYILNRGAKV